MTNEPSLSELSNLPVRPELGGGELTPLIDSSKVVDTLNQNARYQAENTYRKYNEFLQNKKELFANIADLQKLDVAPQDRQYLNEQAGDVL